MIITRSQEILVDVKDMPAARHAMILAIAIPNATHFPDFVGTAMLLLGIGEHARQGRNKSINFGDGDLLHLVKPLHIIPVALFAQTGLTRLGVVGGTVFQGLAVLDRKRHVLVVELLQGHKLLLGALRAAKVGNLHACKVVQVVGVEGAEKSVFYSPRGLEMAISGNFPERVRSAQTT